MQRLPWNSCTTFAAAGSALAYSILIPAFGWYWELIPGGVAGLITAYAVSTILGNWFARINIGRHLVHRIGAGVGAALLTLFCGALAIATTNFLLQTSVDVVRSPAGQPLWNAVAEVAPSHAWEFIVNPVMVGLVYGQWPALVLGVLYGATLRPASPRTDTATAPPSAQVYSASGGGLLIAMLLAGITIVVFNESSPRQHVPVGVPVAIGGCGSAPAAGGVLAFCPGSPCDQGFCEWDTDIDVIAVYVRGPPNNLWKWTGGGMGNTTSPHIVRHHMDWVQPGPDGYFDESNPRRHVSYAFRFEGESVRLQGRSFEFTPGMLLVVRYADDWSYTVSAGEDALRGTGMNVDELQEILDDVCALGFGCERSFRIAG